jgi:hypothetical protein
MIYRGAGDQEGYEQETRSSGEYIPLDLLISC